MIIGLIPRLKTMFKIDGKENVIVYDRFENIESISGVKNFSQGGGKKLVIKWQEVQNQNGQQISEMYVWFKRLVLGCGWRMRDSKSFLPLVKSFFPLTLLKKKNWNWTSGIVLRIDHRRFGNIEKRLKLFSENWTFIFLVDILSILGSLFFSDVGAEKNCNFTNSSLMFIFIFGNVIYDVFTLMETIRRWDFQYFGLSWIDFSHVIFKLFEYPKMIFSNIPFSFHKWL